jgi:hypothetical protein
VVVRTVAAVVRVNRLTLFGQTSPSANAPPLDASSTKMYEQRRAPGSNVDVNGPLTVAGRDVVRRKCR